MQTFKLREEVAGLRNLKDGYETETRNLKVASTEAIEQLRLKEAEDCSRQLESNKLKAENEELNTQVQRLQHQVEALRETLGTQSDHDNLDVTLKAVDGAVARLEQEGNLAAQLVKAIELADSNEADLKERMAAVQSRASALGLPFPYSSVASPCLGQASPFLVEVSEEEAVGSIIGQDAEFQEKGETPASLRVASQ
eukprot:jgi/Mesen1/6961/ME000360S06230